MGATLLPSDNPGRLVVRADRWLRRTEASAPISEASEGEGGERLIS